MALISSSKQAPFGHARNGHPPASVFSIRRAIHMRFSVRGSSLPACLKRWDEYPIAEKSAWLLHEMRQFLIMRLGRRQSERAKVV